MFSVISVRFPSVVNDGEFSSKEYSYLSGMPYIEVGDYVVVETQYSYRLAKVSRLTGDHRFAKKWALSCLTKKGMDDTVSRLNKRYEVYTKIVERVERQDVLERAKVLAENDFALRELLDSFYRD